MIPQPHELTRQQAEQLLGLYGGRAGQERLVAAAHRLGVSAARIHALSGVARTTVARVLERAAQADLQLEIIVSEYDCRYPNGTPHQGSQRRTTLSEEELSRQAQAAEPFFDWETQDPPHTLEQVIADHIRWNQCEPGTPGQWISAPRHCSGSSGSWTRRTEILLHNASAEYCSQVNRLLEQAP